MPLARRVLSVDDRAAPLDDPRAFMEWLVSRAGSQAELARRSALGNDQVSNYVRGVNEPKLPTVLAMMRAARALLDDAPLQHQERVLEELVDVLDDLTAAVRSNDQRLARLERLLPREDEGRGEGAPPR